MDSFYDGPRQPPIPTARTNIDRVPTVPEVSVIEPIFRPTLSKNPTLPFSTNTNHNFYNQSLPDNSIKQVRFEAPKPFTLTNPILNETKENVPHNFQKISPNLQGDSFKQIYMANLPNRHLDLSILEPPTTEIAKITPPEREINNLLKIQEKPTESPIRESYKDFKKNQSDDRLVKANNFTPYTNFRTDSFDATNFRDRILTQRNENPIQHQNGQPHHNFSSPCGTVCEKPSTEIAKPSDEPTIKDLFEIIKQQNEQIMLLQQQVSNLKSSIQPMQPETNRLPFNCGVEDCRPQFLMNSPSKKGIPKFSIDLKATSFEVSFRPQTAAQKFRKQNEFFEPKIQEIVECDNKSGEERKDQINNDLVLDLNDSLTVKDSYVSAVPSIQINMDQYESSEEDDEAEEEQESSINLGTTFYKDLMDQVNNALRSMKVQSEHQNKKKSMSEIKGQTINAVKQATLQHLKSIGVNLPPIQESSEVTSGSQNENEQSEISFAVKQLLMKYLPDDKLAQAMKNDKPEKMRDLVKKNVQKPSAAEFSFATMQYMKKYNILDDKQSPLKQLPPKKQENNPKILDVTALKLQPKLL